MTNSLVERLPTVLTGYGLSGAAELHRFSVAGRMQRRMQAAGTIAAAEEAREERVKSERPFWDAMFRQLRTQPEDVRDDILALAGYHLDMDKVATTTRMALSDEAVRAAIAAELAALSPGQILVLSSRLISDSGQEWHIPMLDYRIPMSTENREIVLRQLRAMKATGLLLHSGRSYHFVGSSLLSGRKV